MQKLEDRITRLALCLGPAKTREDLLRFDPQGAEALERHWSHRPRYPAWGGVASIRELVDSMARMLARLDRQRIRAVMATDPGYPPALARLPRAPSVLFVRGRLPSTECVAIVGTRAARFESLEAARQMAEELARAGYWVLSGGAVGVDAAAHQGALDAEGQTLAVLGSGFDHLYPERNLELFDRIACQGCLCTPFAPDTPPMRHQFPLRNRLIAALARALVVIEAPARSGALITAGWASRLGVPVLARQAGQGTLDLLHEGAGLVSVAQDVLDLLRGGAMKRLIAEPEDPDQLRVLELLRRAPMPVDQVALELGWTPARAAASLIRLELDGLARRDPGGAYRGP